MKIIIASTPATGHLNPLLSIARMLVADGHEVVGMSASSMRDRIEAVGATFYPFPAKADFDLRAIEVVFPELKTMPPGAEMTLFLMKRAFSTRSPRSMKDYKPYCASFARTWL